MFFPADCNTEHYDIHVNHDGSVDIILNQKGWHHYNTNPLIEYIHFK